MSAPINTKKAPEHPPYESMIKAAVSNLKERKGSSRPAIKRYILANFKVSAGSHFDTQISNAIRRGVAKNIFSLPKGMSGTIKLVKPEKKSKETSVEKKDKKTDKKASETPKKKEAVKKETDKKETTKKDVAKKDAPAKAAKTKKAPSTNKKKPAPPSSAKKAGTSRTKKIPAAAIAAA
ncbi:MAG: linker histone H1 and H5 family-domain-containing protein [Benjaminiella poitrasii]|nr:MAG: linker histone H1 and H5 family-domain-containing protein [Benjaminiella poitrasii]